MTTIPTGTIVAYAGKLPAVDTGAVMEVQPGWLLCNGAALLSTEVGNKYLNLFKAISTYHGNGSDRQGVPSTDGSDFNLPDYRGMFLRGVTDQSTRDPDSSAATRPANHPGGNTGNTVGSIQNPATERPNTEFGTDNPGDHTHPFSAVIATPKNGADQGYFWIVNPAQGSTTGGGGNHTHKIVSGGDAETRPINAYVYYLIAY